MPSIHPGYEYDIFISCRQNDNKRDGWVTNFVDALRNELEATQKNPFHILDSSNHLKKFFLVFEIVRKT